MNNVLENKTVLIVGGSSGIGLSVAQALQKHGSKLIIASRSAHSKRAEIVPLLDDKVITQNMDITRSVDIERFWGDSSQIDHLIFTVRPNYSTELFADTDIIQAKAAFDVKFWGEYHFIQKSLNKLRAGGSIIMTSGIAGTKVYPRSSTMALINSATETLVKSLALEISPLRINAVCPGFIRPKSESVTQYAQSFPLQRLGTIDEVCEAYLYLLKSTYVTGSVITVDGGATLI